MRRSRHHLLALACALLAALPVRAAARTPQPEAGLPYFETIGPRDYRGHTQVWSAGEDRAGLLYFGNYGRVLVHDGARWSHVEVPDGSFVRALAVDADDTLWLGGVGELGHARTDAFGRRTFVSLKAQLPPEARHCGEIWRIVLTARGPVFLTNSWLLRWDGHAFAALSLSGNGGWQLMTVGDAVWVTHQRHGWFRLEDDGRTLQLAPLARPANFDSGSLFFSWPSETAGEFILGSLRGGLLRWRDGQLTKFPTEVDDLLKTQLLYQGLRLPDGRLVLCTLQGGAFLLDADGRLLAHLNQNAGLPDNAVLSAFADRSGGLWLSLEKGLVRVDTRRWLTWLGPARGAPPTTLGAPLRWRGELLLPTSNGMHRLAPTDGLKEARIAPLPGATDYVSGTTLVDGELVVWGAEGIAQWNDARPTWWRDAHLSDVFAFTASRAQPGRWFVLASGKLLTFRRDGARWIAEGTVPNLPHVRTIAEEADGTCWLGTPGEGVYRVRFPHATPTAPGAPEIQPFGRERGLPVGHGWSRVGLLGEQPLLTCERGFFRLDATRERFVPTREFGPQFADGSTTARNIEPDRNGGLWIAARPAGNAELVTALQVGLADASGWHPLHLPQLAQLDDVNSMRYEPEGDVLWISGHGGLLRLDLAEWRRTPPAPAPVVQLRAVTTDRDAPLPLAAGWQLPFARRVLHLDFAAPALAGDVAAEFETTLRGDGLPLVQTSAAPEREFAALSAGRYTLHIRARGSVGAWSEPLEIAFTVLPPWWWSPWAWMAYAALGGGAVAGFVAFRTRALRRRAEKLEAAIAARTEELRRSNEELARLHRLELDEKTAARLAEEKARLEVLRYQLNPHFLFNALTSVCAQLPPSLPGARATIERLTDFCQATLFRDETHEHPLLADELRMLGAYLEIEKARWGDTLATDVRIDPATAPARVPSLLLLPLLENALKYGRETSPGTLQVRLHATLARDGTLAIEVGNTGRWHAPGGPAGRVPSLGIGLENLRQRLLRYYAGAHELTTEEADGWVVVRLRLSHLEPSLLPAASVR